MNNENKGFSLVELIVVIAIMAVLTSVLAPSLLGYVEKSRMQKDDSAMGEVANAIQLALADQNVYDECLTYSFKGNYSCYIDSETSYTDSKYKVEDKNRGTNTDSVGKVEDVDDWHYVDSTRLKDEQEYVAAGNMRGMTISFKKSSQTSGNSAVFILAEAKINNMDADPGTGAKTIDDDKQGELKTITSANGQPGMLYNKLRAVIGDNITLSSQTYRNSTYTVFIRMGSMGGNDVSAQDAIAVYGQWNGTNLEPDATAAAPGGAGGAGGEGTP